MTGPIYPDKIERSPREPARPREPGAFVCGCCGETEKQVETCRVEGRLICAACIADTGKLRKALRARK